MYHNRPLKVNGDFSNYWSQCDQYIGHTVTNKKMSSYNIDVRFFSLVSSPAGHCKPKSAESTKLQPAAVIRDSLVFSKSI